MSKGPVLLCDLRQVTAPWAWMMRGLGLQARGSVTWWSF